MTKLRLIIEMTGEDLEITRMETRGVVERQEEQDGQIWRDPVKVQELLNEAVAYVMGRHAEPKYKIPDQLYEGLSDSAQETLRRVVALKIDQQEREIQEVVLAGPPDALHWIVSGGDKCPICQTILHFYVDPFEDNNILGEWCPNCHSHDTDFPEDQQWIQGLTFRGEKSG